MPLYSSPRSSVSVSVNTHFYQHIANKYLRFGAAVGLFCPPPHPEKANVVVVGEAFFEIFASQMRKYQTKP